MLVLKLLRLYRLTAANPLEEQFTKVLSYIMARDMSRSEKISADLNTQAVIRVVKLLYVTLIAIYLQGVLWYRFSESWQKSFIPNDNESFYFVRRFGIFNV